MLRPVNISKIGFGYNVDHLLGKAYYYSIIINNLNYEICNLRCNNNFSFAYKANDLHNYNNNPCVTNSKSTEYILTVSLIHCNIKFQDISTLLVCPIELTVHRICISPSSLNLSTEIISILI